MTYSLDSIFIIII